MNYIVNLHWWVWSFCTTVLEPREAVLEESRNQYAWISVTEDYFSNDVAVTIITLLNWNGVAVVLSIACVHTERWTLFWWHYSGRRQVELGSDSKEKPNAMFSRGLIKKE